MWRVHDEGEGSCTPAAEMFVCHIPALYILQTTTTDDDDDDDATTTTTNSKNLMNMKLLMNTHQYIDYIYIQIVLYVCIGMHITTLEKMRYIWCRERERNLEHLYALSSAGKSSQIRFNSFLNINNSLNKYTTTKQT